MKTSVVIRSATDIQNSVVLITRLKVPKKALPEVEAEKDASDIYSFFANNIPGNTLDELKKLFQEK